MNSQRLFIVTISNHPVLGPVLVPFFAGEVSPGVIRMDENATAKQTTADLEDASVKRIIRLAQAITDRKLMKTYSKERTISEFLRNLSPKILTENIRPYIDKKNYEIITLMREANIPLYLRDVGADLLYEHHLVELSANNVEVSFHCEATDHYFRYGIRSFLDNRPVQLRKATPFLILSAEPAIILLGRELLVFEHIRVGRITPFIEKSYVEVPASETRRYMEKIIIPLMKDFTVEASGFEIREIVSEKKAEITLAPSLAGGSELVLKFFYGDTEFFANQKERFSYPRLEEDGGKPWISYFRRDMDWERHRVNYLQKSGFKQISDTIFSHEGLPANVTLIDWVVEHKEELAQLFSFNNTEGTYFLGAIELKQEIADKEDWFEVKIVVQIGDFSYPFIAFKKNIISGQRHFHLPDGRIVLLPEEWFSKYSDLFEFGEERDGKMALRKIQVGLIEDLNINESTISKADYLKMESVAVPPKIKATLRPYQQTGFSWLVHLSNNRFGGCLADDMGLGKTLQTITLLQHIYDAAPPAPSLPTVSLSKADEFGQFSLFGDTDEEPTVMESTKTAPSLPPCLIVMPTSLLPNWKKEIRKFSSLRVYEYSGIKRARNIEQVFSRYNIVLITYGLLRRDIELLETFPFKYVILDESQYIKNPESQTYLSAVRLKSEHRLVLTGTPIENSLKDLWAQFNFINPGLLGTFSAFRDRYIIPITREGNTSAQNTLLRLISPFILRRTKRQVAPELPPLTEEVIYCEMTPEQEDIYKKEKNALRNLLWADNKLIALNGIMRLRQLANHPKLIYSEFEGASGKMEQILEAYETLLSEGHKVLIFSSFVTILDLLAAEFKQHGWNFAMLTGTTIDREKEIERFSTDTTISAFLISLKAGGVGLNLTEADYVFIIDPWWNPAAEMQAESRAHRIGQDKQVFVYRFISSHTIEDKIRALQERKTALANAFISENNPLESLSDQDWQELLSE